MELSQNQTATTLPRGLIFLASAWLLVSWLIAVGLRPPIHPSTSVYKPAAQVLLTSIVLGGIIAWPLLRLSGPVRDRPIAQALLDLVSLCVLIQIVLWPLRLVTSWSIARLLLIDLSICAWLTTAGAIIAAAITHRGMFRTCAMALLLAWLLVPLAVSIGELPGTENITTSPLGSIWHLTSEGGSLTELNAWIWLGVGWGVAIFTWGLVPFLSSSRRFQSTDDSSSGGDSPLY